MAMVLRALDRLEEIIIAALIAVATVIIFVAVVQRYGLSNIGALMGWARSVNADWLFALAKTVFVTLNSVNLTWAQELCIYLFIWMAKFGAAYGVRTGIHVGVDLLLNYLPARPRYGMIVFGLLCGALFTAIVGGLGANFVWHMAHTEQTSPDLELPMWIVYLAVPLGSWLMCFRFLQVAWSFARTGELPLHDHGHVEGISEADAGLLTEPHLHPRDIHRNGEGGKP